MLDGGEVLGGAQFCKEFLEGVVYKLGLVVGDYRSWDAKASKDIPFVEAEDVLGSDFGQIFCFYPFGKVIDRYD